MNNKYHVVKNGDQWGVKREGASRCSSLAGTQSEAIEQARGFAMPQKGQVFVHRPDGRIREERTYRKDPYPPKG